MKHSLALLAVTSSLVGVANAAPVVAAAQPEAPEVVATEETPVVAVKGTSEQPDPGVVPDLTSGPVSVKLYGSIRPAAGVTYHQTAVERDRVAYGVTGSRLDVGATAKVGGGVSSSLYVRIGTDTNEEGKTVGTIGLEKALVRYEPIDGLRFSIGRDSVPLSAQSATPTWARVFPSRIALDNSFVLPADVGAQVSFATNYVTALTGVWNGIARDARFAPGNSERGLLYSVRVEVTPLGSLGFDERERPDSLRVGLGVAAAYRAATEFTPTGMTGTRTRDLRASLSVRAAWRGLFVQAEALRKQITDDFTTRPDVATAGYVQASWRFLVRSVDLAPLARMGVEKQRQLSAPSTRSTAEVGLSAYPLARGTDRLQLTLLGVREDDSILGAAYTALTVAKLGF